MPVQQCCALQATSKSYREPDLHKTYVSASDALQSSDMAVICQPSGIMLIGIWIPNMISMTSTIPVGALGIMIACKTVALDGHKCHLGSIWCSSYTLRRCYCLVAVFWIVLVTVVVVVIMYRHLRYYAIRPSHRHPMKGAWWLAGWLADWLAGRLDACRATWLPCYLVVWLPSCLVAWPAWLAGGLAAWLPGSLGE